MLVQPAQSLTDLALGLVTLYLALRLPRGTEAARYWRATFLWAALAALAGAVYHGVLVGIPRVSHVSWAITSSMVVVVMTFLLAASVLEVVGRGRAAVFWPLRLVGLAAYAVVAATGHASITAILACESLTVAGVLGLWIRAWRRRHPRARPMLLAVGVSIAAAALRLVPGAAGLTGLDPDSAYHLGQIAGVLLLFRAVSAPARVPEGDPTPPPSRAVPGDIVRVDGSLTAGRSSPRGRPGAARRGGGASPPRRRSRPGGS